MNYVVERWWVKKYYLWYQIGNKQNEAKVEDSLPHKLQFLLIFQQLYHYGQFIKVFVILNSIQNLILLLQSETLRRLILFMLAQ